MRNLGSVVNLVNADDHCGFSSEAYDGVGRANFIRGSITIDGRRIDYPPGAALDSGFDQSDFDARYACTEDLAAPVAPAD